MPSNRRLASAHRFLNALVVASCLCTFAFSQEPVSPPTAPAPSPTPPPAPPPLVIMIDAAHGGAESGALLAPDLLEKDVTLAFSRRLRQDLLSRGLQAHLLREGDVQLSTDQRAAIVNSSNPVLYICVHMSSQGSGLRIYSAMLTGSSDNRGPFISWQTAQSESLTKSRSLQQQLTEVIQRNRFPTKSLSAALRPLNAITVPALAVEIAPANGQVSQLASADYQNMVSAVLANAIVTVRERLENKP